MEPPAAAQGMEGPAASSGEAELTSGWAAGRPAGGGAGRGRGKDAEPERTAKALPSGSITTPGPVAAAGEVAASVPRGPESREGSAEDGNRPAVQGGCEGLRDRLRSRDAVPTAECCPRTAGSSVVCRSAWSSTASSGLWLVNSETKEWPGVCLPAAGASCSANPARVVPRKLGHARGLSVPGTPGESGAEAPCSASAWSASW
jgi:hypothetical protein